MSNIKYIAIDALGGDYAPEQVVEGALRTKIPIILVGAQERLKTLVQEHGGGENVEYVDAPEAVGMDEHPVAAYRTKKNSSMMTAIRLVKEGRAAGVMSAGNTGAFMMGATMILGRLSAVSRPAAAIPIPTTTGLSLLLDAGASADIGMIDYVNFAVMGSQYAKYIWNIDNPKIGLLSIGEEESKGNKEARDAHKFLKQSNLNFIGNVQGSDFGTTLADVIVTDGFTGNVALKVAEGMATLVMTIVKNEMKCAKGIEAIAAVLLRPLFKRVKKRLDWQEYGGGALLGVKGNVVIAHGKSKSRAIESATKLAYDLAQTDLLHRLEDALKEYHKPDDDGDQKNVLIGDVE